MNLLLLSLFLGADPTPTHAWPGFRGDGTSTSTAKNLPLTWSPTENLAWRTPLPGYGQSSPVVWKDRVFVTAIDGAEKEKLIVAAVDVKTGKAAWAKEFAATQKGKNNPMMSRAAPTPVVDAEAVYAVFESGDVVALSHAGEVKWERSLSKDYGAFRNNHGVGSSPAQTDTTVVILIDDLGPFYLIALDKATGKNVWKTDRTSRASWTSPVVTRTGARPVVLVSSGGSLDAYDAATGKELATLGGLVGNTIPSPAVAGDLVVLGAGENRTKPDLVASTKSNCCLRLVRKGDEISFEPVWDGKKAISHHASPLVHKGYAYFVTKTGLVHCVDLKTGAERYAERLDNPCWATPIGAGDHVFFFGKDGVTTVLRAGPEFDKVAANRVWSAADFAKRQGAAEEKAAATLPKPPESKGPGGGPPLPTAELDATSNVDGPDAEAPDEKPKQGKTPRPFARLFIQDLRTSSLKWADVRIGEKGEFTLDPLAAVDGFKALDATKQKLVQMEESGGLVCVGVRDDEGGAFESGWVLVRSGVGYTDHGDHGHWTFKNPPAVADCRLDSKQGNPAHLYRYGGRFFLANDKLNGYTRIDPAGYEGADKDTPRFVTGGGGHITLAVVGDTVGYGCWIDGGGPNKGRVDVTPLGAGAKSEPAYPFRLPTGGIHGANANSGKVFFAPSDGVCWVEADAGAKLNSDQVKVRHIPLGKDGDKPRRTGAFANHGHHVVFVTGKESNAALVLLNAKDAEPKPVFVPLGVKKGTQAVTPVVATTADGTAYAFVFHDRVKDAEADDALEVVALDPNGDGDCSDAKVVKTLKVGRRAVDGHSGHHGLAFDADRRFGFFTNPGDGTVCVLSLKTLEVVATFSVGGTPTAVVACGSRETED